MIAPDTKKHLSQMDAFRCLAAFLVVMVHCTSPTTLSSDFPAGSINEVIIHYFWLLSLCCVDCFAILSGYIGGSRNHRFSSYGKLYLQVFFYLLILFIISRCGLKTFPPLMVRKLFPVTGGGYWYFSAYTIVAVLLPLLQYGCEKMTQKEFRCVVLGLLLIYSACEILPWGSRVLGGLYGFSAIWLVVLYITGAYLRRFPLSLKYFSGKYALLIALLIPLFGSLLYELYYHWGCERYLQPFGVTQIFSVALCNDRAGAYSVMYYTHPLIALESIFLLVCFSRLKLERWGKIAAFAAPYAFGVYLVHCNGFFSVTVKEPLMAWSRSVSAFFYIPAIFGTIIGIYVFCIGIDFLRDRIFKIIHIPQFLNRLEDWIKTREQ